MKITDSLIDMNATNISFSIMLTIISTPFLGLSLDLQKARA
jgi:hypothetical protein